LVSLKLGSDSHTVVLCYNPTLESKAQNHRSDLYATTAFWCLAIIVIVLCFGKESNVGSLTEGFSDLNTESQPVTFMVAEMPTNGFSSYKPEIVLLERELPPQGMFWIDIKQTKPGNK
jgi:hypothetical protein